jgi:hypothetical protein
VAVLAEPKKLPTCKVKERFVCQWEQLGVPCPTDTDHYTRNSHRVCSYCWVLGHVLHQCEYAKKDGLTLK